MSEEVDDALLARRRRDVRTGAAVGSALRVSIATGVNLVWAGAGGEIIVSLRPIRSEIGEPASRFKAFCSAVDVPTFSPTKDPDSEGVGEGRRMFSGACVDMAK